MALKAAGLRQPRLLSGVTDAKDPLSSRCVPEKRAGTYPEGMTGLQPGVLTLGLDASMDPP